MGIWFSVCLRFRVWSSGKKGRGGLIHIEVNRLYRPGLGGFRVSCLGFSGCIGAWGMYDL